MLLHVGSAVASTGFDVSAPKGFGQHVQVQFTLDWTNCVTQWNGTASAVVVLQDATGHTG